jgi:hypothetical protein
MAYGGDGEVAVASERRRLVLKPRDPDAAARADDVRAASAKSVRAPFYWAHLAFLCYVSLDFDIW